MAAINQGFDVIWKSKDKDYRVKGNFQLVFDQKIWSQKGSTFGAESDPMETETGCLAFYEKGKRSKSWFYMKNWDTPEEKRSAQLLKWWNGMSP